MSDEVHKHDAVKDTIRLVFRITRWAFAVALLVIGFPLSSMYSPFMLAFGILLIAPDIVSFLTRNAGGILWGSRGGKVQPIYGIPEARACEGRYEEAIAEYEAIMEEFPGEVKPYVEIIEIACRRLNDAGMAKEYYDRGMAAFSRRPEDQGRIEAMYRANSSFLR